MEIMCKLCHWPTDQDDVTVRFHSGEVICLRCQARTVGDERRVSKRLQREIATEEDALRNQKIGPDPRIAHLGGM
jgi:recombinational DNA repair protein (RecF pathway)